MDCESDPVRRISRCSGATVPVSAQTRPAFTRANSRRIRTRKQTRFRTGTQSDDRGSQSFGPCPAAPLNAHFRRPGQSIPQRMVHLLLRVCGSPGASGVENSGVWRLCAGQTGLSRRHILRARLKSHLVALSLPALHVRVLSTAIPGFLPESTPPDILSGVSPECAHAFHTGGRVSSRFLNESSNVSSNCPPVVAIFQTSCGDSVWSVRPSGQRL